MQGMPAPPPPGMPTDGQVGVAADRLIRLSCVRHQMRNAGGGVEVGFLTGRALGERCGRGGGCRDDGDRRRCRYRNGKSTGNDQSSCWKLQGRHRHAFCRFTDRSRRGDCMETGRNLQTFPEFPGICRAKLRQSRRQTSDTKAEGRTRKSCPARPLSKLRRQCGASADQFAASSRGLSSPPNAALRSGLRPAVLRTGRCTRRNFVRCKGCRRSPEGHRRGRCFWNCWRIRHDVGHADIGELVFGLTAGTRRDRRRRAAGRRNGEHCDRWCRSDRDSESPRKDQSLSWKVEGRHRHAFCSLLTVSSGKCMDAASDLVAILRFPAYASSEVVTGVGIC